MVKYCLCIKRGWWCNCVDFSRRVSRSFGFEPRLALEFWSQQSFVLRETSRFKVGSRGVEEKTAAWQRVWSGAKKLSKTISQDLGRVMHSASTGILLECLTNELRCSDQYCEGFLWVSVCTSRFEVNDKYEMIMKKCYQSIRIYFIFSAIFAPFNLCPAIFPIFDWASIDSGIHRLAAYYI